MLKTNSIFGAILLILWTNLAFAGPSLPSGKALSACIANNLFNDGCRNCEKATVISSERTNSKKIPYASGLEVMFTSKIKIPSSGIWQGDHGLYFQHCPNDICPSQMFLPKVKYPAGSVVTINGMLNFEETEKGYMCHEGYMEIKEVQVVKLGPAPKVSESKKELSVGKSSNESVLPAQEEPIFPAEKKAIQKLLMTDITKPSPGKIIQKLLMTDSRKSSPSKFTVRDIKIIDIYASAYRDVAQGETDFCLMKHEGKRWKILDCGSGVFYEKDDWVQKGIPTKLFDKEFKLKK